jgi:thioesterase domain-containing protein
MEGRLAVFPVAGRHTQILGEPHVRDLASRLRRALEEATAGTAAA